MSVFPPIRDDTRPERAPGVYTRDLDGEQVVYDPASHEIVVLNETAAFVFGLCDGTRSVVDLLGALERRYDAPAARLRSDLLAVLDDLRAKRLISG
jgi:hypothetical protein